MKNATIINNKPVCPKCGEAHHSKIKVIDVGVAKIYEERYFEVIIRCRNCDTLSYYFLDLEMLKRISIIKDSEYYTKIFDVE